MDELKYFLEPNYQSLNEARLRHLESLKLPLENRTVLEVGCGPGDHTGFYVQRNCEVTSVDARHECLSHLAARYPAVRTHRADLNNPTALEGLSPAEVIHCYGLLYHLDHPENGIASMGAFCLDLMILESCVSLGDQPEVRMVDEDKTNPTQSSTGRGCRPTRSWLFEEVGKHFSFVYQTRTQPRHKEFPLDWTIAQPPELLTRIVLVGSRHALDLPTLNSVLLDHLSHGD